MLADDNGTVWVNGKHGLVARFSKTGIDIHSPGEDNHCLDCQHRATTKNDWVYFVEKVEEVYGVDLKQKLPGFRRITSILCSNNCLC